MDRDRSDGSRPEEPGAFDLTKGREAEVAAEIAARMVSWRRSRKQPASPARAPGTVPSIARPPAARPAPAPPPAHGPAPVGPPVSLRGLDPVTTARMDRALRMAAGPAAPEAGEAGPRPARTAPAPGGEFAALLAQGLATNAGATNAGATNAVATNAVSRAPDPGPEPARRDAASYDGGALGKAPQAGAAAPQPVEPAPDSPAPRPALTVVEGPDIGARQTSAAASQSVRPAPDNPIARLLRRGRALRPAPRPDGVARGLRRARARGVVAGRAGLAAWRSLTSSLGSLLEDASDRARTQSRAFGAAARNAGAAARHAAQLAPAGVGRAQHQARAVAATAWQTAQPALAGGIERARHQARTVAAAARQVPAHRLAIAGASAAVVAIAAVGLLLVPRGQPAPEVARAPEAAASAVATAPADVAVEPASAAPQPDAPPTLAAASAATPQPDPPPAPETPAPDTATGFIPPKLKPIPPAPALVARLKPPVPETEPDPAPAAVPPPESPEPADEPPQRANPRDADSLFDQLLDSVLGR